MLVMLVVIVPLLALKASESAKIRHIVLGLATFDLFNPMHVNLISQEHYRGDSRGIEVTTVDLLILSLFISQRLRRQPIMKGRRFLFVRGLYLFFVLLSFSASPDWLKSFFGLWKILRMYFYFDTVATAFLELDMLAAGLMGLAVGVVSQGLIALKQKYVFHFVRVFGSQSHPNSLAMVVNLNAPTAFSLLLSGKGKKITIAVVALAGLCDIFTLSRGGMMMFVASMGLVYLGSFIRGVTKRKIIILLLAMFAGTLVLAKSADTIYKRFTEAPKESMEARHMFNHAAKHMADEHTFGVGINMFSRVLDKGGYADRVGLPPVDRNGLAHHIYWLTSAELGYGGAAAFILLLLAIHFDAIRATKLKGVRGDIALGVVAGLTVTHLQGTAEWIMRQTGFGYAFWTYAAITASLTTYRQGLKNKQ